MKELLSGKKKVFQNHEIVQVKAPRYREMTVAKVYEMVADVPAILNYLPSQIDGECLPREYFFNVSLSQLKLTASFFQIVNTVVPSFFAKVIPDAEAKRQ